MVNWHIVSGVAAAIVQIYSIIPYIKDILKGRTRPNAVSWFLWMVMAVIVAAGQICAGTSWTLFLPLAIAFNTSLVFIISIKGYGYKKYGRTDFVCLAGAIVAIVAWIATKNPVTAIWLIVTADLISTIPTILKTRREPFSEFAFSWLLLSLGAVLAIASTEKYDIANLLYPAYTAGITFLIWWLAYSGQQKQKS